VPRYQKFESISLQRRDSPLQRRVCELSVPERFAAQKAAEMIAAEHGVRLAEFVGERL
jgi:hypothetical protein